MKITVRRLAILALACCQGACLQREKGGKTGAWAPPWDSARHSPRSLKGLPPAATDSLFGVFLRMEIADSMAAASPESISVRDPVDTLRVHSLFDTSFIFPAHGVASMPFAFDDDYRDDTLFRKYFGNGLFEQEHPCVETWVLSGEFPHPAKWLRSGMRSEEIVGSLGTPRARHAVRMRYRWHSEPGEDGDSLARHESIGFYFEQDSLYAAMLQRSKPCF